MTLLEDISFFAAAKASPPPDMDSDLRAKPFFASEAEEDEALAAAAEMTRKQVRRSFIGVTCFCQSLG